MSHIFPTSYSNIIAEMEFFYLHFFTVSSLHVYHVSISSHLISSMLEFIEVCFFKNVCQFVKLDESMSSKVFSAGMEEKLCIHIKFKV